MKRLSALVVVILSLSPMTAAAASPGYYRYPALHNDTLVFVAEGDLWKVAASGGEARRLTTHHGLESHAAVSPDGTTVAFVGHYEGEGEVYTIPLAGGAPKRLTWENGSATVAGWTPTGQVLYATRAYSTLPETQLMAVDPVTLNRSLIPLSQASDGCYEPSGATLFFTRLPFQGSHTKRYRGGTAQNLWKLATGATEAEPLTPDYPGTSKTPMWWQDRIYFVSDRDGTMNLWSMTEAGGDQRQHTRHAGWDVATPSLSSGRIAYKLGADIRVFDIAAGGDAEVSITLASDFDQLREKWVDKPIDFLTAAHPSPDGDRVVLTARGQVFVAPVKKGQGRLVEVTRREGVRYREARFLPGGESLVALSDESGEVEWWRLPANGVGEPQRITSDGTVLRFDGVPSPDGSRVASVDKDLQLWVHDLVTGASTKVATSPHWGFGAVSWSPDSRYLAYGIPAPNTFTQIEIYDLTEDTTMELTGERTESDSPAWSTDGKWLYFLSDRNLSTLVRSPWGPRQPEPFLDSPSKVYAIALQPGLRFPFLAADELAPEDELDKEGKAKANPKEQGSADVTEKPKVVVTVVREDLARRLYEVPVNAGRYSSLAANDKRLFWLAQPLERGADATLMALDISREDFKAASLVAGVDSFELTGDGNKILVRKDDDLYVLDASAKKDANLSEACIDLSHWRFSLDPREEYRQMFREAWRLERDYFYDLGMHGVDWPAVLAKYEPLADRVTDRSELSDLLAQMVSELSALHIFVRGGDLRAGKDDVESASLGAVLERNEDAGGWRVAHVYRSDPDYPDELAPLARPGVGVGLGDVVLAINGVSTLSVEDPAVLLRGQAGRQVLLHVKPVAGENRDVIVEPVSPSEETDLRYSEWELTRRLRVEEASRGAIGYVHLRAMGGDNYEEWVRSFYPVYDRAGLILDVRHNRGGNIDSWILEKLLRKAWFFWQPRRGEPYWNMQYAFRGHMVVLVDQRTASDGEAFAEGFRRLGLGKVIGMRTWGGEIWLSSSNFLVDRGIATAAETGVYGPEGEWLIEGWGVEPDIVVDNLPHATFKGQDAQLEAAIHYLQQRIREQPVEPPSPPPYPDKSAGASAPR